MDNKIYYDDNYKQKQKKLYTNWIKFAQIFDLNLDEEFHMVRYDHIGKVCTYKITEYGIFELINGKWCSTCNMERAMLLGVEVFKPKKD